MNLINLIPVAFAIIAPIVFKAINSQIEPAGIVLSVGIGAAVGFIIRSILIGKK